jgi:hypothetical protein
MVAVVIAMSKAPAPRLLEEGMSKLPSSPDTVRNSLAESSVMARRRVDAPL